MSHLKSTITGWIRDWCFHPRLQENLPFELQNYKIFWGRPPRPPHGRGTPPPVPSPTHSYATWWAACAACSSLVSPPVPCQIENPVCPNSTPVLELWNSSKIGVLLLKVKTCHNSDDFDEIQGSRLASWHIRCDTWNQKRVKKIVVIFNEVWDLLVGLSSLLKRKLTLQSYRKLIKE